MHATPSSRTHSPSASPARTRTVPAHSPLMAARGTGPPPVVRCAWCGRQRDRDGRWVPVPEARPPAEVSHGLCPDCYAALVAELRATE